MFIQKWIHLEVNIYLNAHSLFNTIQNKESAMEEIWTETEVLTNHVWNILLLQIL